MTFTKQKKKFRNVCYVDQSSQLWNLLQGTLLQHERVKEKH